MNEVVKKLKKSIEYRSKHKKIIKEFEYEIINYFLNKYDAHVRVLTFVTHFGIEKNYNYYANNIMEEKEFEFTIKVLYDFCEEFDCEFMYTACDGRRYIFTFKDVDMSNAFLNG